MVLCYPSTIVKYPISSCVLRGYVNLSSVRLDSVNVKKLDVVLRVLPGPSHFRDRLVVARSATVRVCSVRRFTLTKATSAMVKVKYQT